MKLTSAAVALATAVVDAARLRRDAQHQAERNEALLAGNQLGWLSQMSTKPDLAKLWAPDDMEAEEYMQLMSASSQRGTRRFQFSGTALRSCRRRTCGTPSAAPSWPHTS